MKMLWRSVLFIAILISLCISMVWARNKAYSSEIISNSPNESFSRQIPIMVLEIAWSPSGDYLAVGRNNGLWLYDENGDEINHIEGSSVSSIAWSPDSALLAASEDTRGWVLILSVPTLEILDSHVRASGGEHEIPLSWNPNATLPVLASAAGRDVLFWNTSSWGNFDSLQNAHADTISVLEWSPDGSKLASGGFDYMVYVWDYPSGDQLESLEVGDYVKDINWLDDNATVVLPDIRGRILFWNYLNDTTTTTETGSFVVYDVELNSEIIAASTSDGLVYVRDREADATPYSLETQLRALSIDIAPDGRSVTYPGSNGSTETSEVLPVIAPSNLTAVPIPLDKVRLTWQDNFDTETAFYIEWYLNGSWTEIATVTANQTTYTHVGLVCNKDTQYRIRAYRQSDNEFSPYSTQVYVRADNCGPDKIALFNTSDTQARLFTTLTFPPRPPDTGYIHYWVGGTHTGQWFMGDWNGDGVDTPAVFNNGTYWYTNTPSATATDWTQINVQANEYPAVGRFDLNIGHDCLGVIDSILFPPDTIVFMLGYTCNLTGGTSPTLSYQWLSSILPSVSGDYQFVSGDWNSDGVDTIAARRSEYISYTNVAPGQNAVFDQAQYFGNPYNGQYPGLYGNLVAGDWNYDGIDTFGYFYADGNFYWRDHLEWNQPISGSTILPQPFGTYVIPTTWR